MSLKEMIRVTNRLLKDGVSVYLMVDGRIDEKISNYLFATEHDRINERLKLYRIHKVYS